jgi:hypothetical protein
MQQSPEDTKDIVLIDISPKDTAPKDTAPKDSGEDLTPKPRDQQKKPDPGEDTPDWYFFYGTLMEPEWLAEIAGFDTLPDMVPGYVFDSQIKYWGPYPVLAQIKPTPGHDPPVVHGAMCYIPNVEAVRRLRDYETQHYKESAILVNSGAVSVTAWGYRHGEQQKGCRVFVWHAVEEEKFLSDMPTEDPQAPLGWD